MKKTIFYFLAVMTVCFFTGTKLCDACCCDRELLLRPSNTGGGASSTQPVGATFEPVLGPGEIKLQLDYRAHSVPLNLEEIRRVLMPWTSVEPDGFVAQAWVQFSMPANLAEGLFHEYKRHHEATQAATQAAGAADPKRISSSSAESHCSPQRGSLPSSRPSISVGEAGSSLALSYEGEGPKDSSASSTGGSSAPRGVRHRPPHAGQGEEG